MGAPPTAEASLRSHVMHASAANFAVAVAQWLILIEIAKLFPYRELSLFVFSLSVVSPIFLVTSLKLRSIVVIDVDGQTPLTSFVITRLTTSIIALIFSVSVLCYITGVGTWSIALSIALFKFFDSVSELLHSYFQRIQRFDLVTKLKLCRSVAVVASGLITAMSGRSFLTFCVVLALVYLVFVVIDVLYAASLDRNFRFGKLDLAQLRTTLMHVAKYGHLGVSLVAGSLFVYAPNYFLENFHGLETVGAFGAITYFLVAGGVFISGISQAATPRLARCIRNREFREFQRLVSMMVWTGFGIGIAGVAASIVVGQRVLALLYNSQVAELHFELVLIAVVALISYSYIFLGTALTAASHLFSQTVTSIVGLFAIVILSYFLIPRFGTVGAAYSMLISAAVMAILLLVIFVHFCRKLRYVVPNG